MNFNKNIVCSYFQTRNISDFMKDAEKRRRVSVIFSYSENGAHEMDICTSFRLPVNSGNDLK